jgi:hypothetical protein
MAIATRITVGALGAALVLLVPATPAVSAAATGTSGSATATVGRLVLEPSSRGYQGELPVTITNPTDSYVSHVLITEPVAGSWRGTVSDEFCLVTVPKQFVRTFDCALPIGPGETYSVTARFEVLTPARPYAMSAVGGQVAVQVGYESPSTTTAAYRTVFRGTTGSLRHPRPYEPDASTRASIAVGEARLTRQEDGRWAGWLPVTVRYRGDAPHNHLGVLAALPAAVDMEATDPGDLPVFGTGFVVPGGRFMAGEVRIFRVLVTAPAGTAPGTLGTGEFVLAPWYEGGDVPEATPRDNVATFPIEAGGS